MKCQKDPIEWTSGLGDRCFGRIALKEGTESMEIHVLRDVHLWTGGQCVVRRGSDITTAFIVPSVEIECWPATRSCLSRKYDTEGKRAMLFR